MTEPGFIEAGAPVWIARAPGRLDVMGGIADYSGATVLQLPLACATTATVQRQAAPRCDLATRRGGEWHSFSIDLSRLMGDLQEPAALGAWIAETAPDRWPAYLAGVLQYCLGRAPTGDRAAGFRIQIDSNVPEGSGVASSAALEVAAMSAVTAALKIDMTPEALAAACQWVENHVVGAPCGIMDQMTSACGRQGALMRLRCQPATIEGYLPVPAGYRFYGIDSGLRHAVTGADYGTVRAAAFMGLRIIEDPRWRGYLANVPTAEFSSRLERLLPEMMDGYPVRAATAHPIFEQPRVERFAELLGGSLDHPDAPIELGQLMLASHRSYGACGLGSEGTDRLVEMVVAAGPGRGVFGARITGGGSGGTVAVFATEAAEPVVRGIAAAYRAETGRGGEVFGG